MKLSETIDKILFNYSLVMTQSEFREKAIAEILSALASTPDEKLLLTSDEKTKIAPYSNAQFPMLIMNITKAQLAKVQPVITALRAKLAEAENEKQQAVEKAVKAERKRILASTPDEGLREVVAAYLQFEEQKKMPPSWSDVQKKHQLGRAAAILSLVQPVITALRAKLAEAEKVKRNALGEALLKCDLEAEKEKQEAIKVNNASWEGRLQGKIDYAVEQERKAIGKWLAEHKSLFMYSFQRGANFGDVIESLQRGESLEVKHDQ